jgi:hypothetical protein
VYKSQPVKSAFEIAEGYHEIMMAAKIELAKWRAYENVLDEQLAEHEEKIKNAATTTKIKKLAAERLVKKAARQSLEKSNESREAATMKAAKEMIGVAKKGQASKSQGLTGSAAAIADVGVDRFLGLSGEARRQARLKDNRLRWEKREAESKGEEGTNAES